MIRSRPAVISAIAVGVAAALSVVLAQSPGDRIDQLLLEGDRLMAASRFDEAAAAAGQAETLSRASGDLRRQARARHLTGQALYGASRPLESVEAFRSAAVLAHQAGDPALEARAQTAAGSSLRIANRFGEALEALSAADALARQAGDQAARADALRGQGMVHVEIGDYDEAERVYRQTLDLARAAGAGSVEALALNNMAILERRRGKPAVALDYVQRALAHPGLPRDVTTRLNLLNSLANIQVDLGQPHKAIAAYEDGLREVPTLYMRGLLLSNIGITRARIGECADAIPALVDARAELNRAGDYPEKTWEIELQLGRCYRAGGQTDRALAALRDAIATTERLRDAAAPSESSRAAAIAIRRDAIAEAADLFFALDRAADAFAITEQYRGRAFLDRIAESKVDLRGQLSVTQRDTETRLLARVADRQRQLWTAAAGSRQATEQSLAEAEQELEQFAATLRRANSRYAAVRYPAALDVGRVQAALGDGTVLVEYLLGRERSFVWTVTRDRLVMREMPRRELIERAIDDYRAALARPVSALTAASVDRALTAAGNVLFDALLRPIEAELDAARRVVVVADGPLAYLPVDTIGPRPLFERIPVSFAVSGSALALGPETWPVPPAAAGLLAVGDPAYGETSAAGFDLVQLPATRREVDAIAALYPTRTVLLGQRATEAAVKAAPLDRYRYLHFAVHGIIDERVPSRSGIALSASAAPREDGILQFREILQLRLNADLVTLSACSTGIGRLVEGEGVIGLTRAFMYAGARNVVVSLWNVNDAATAELMRGFYSALTRGGQKDEALRRARLSLARGQNQAWRHPYYWAPFVLMAGSEPR